MLVGWAVLLDFLLFHMQLESWEFPIVETCSSTLSFSD